MKRISDWVIPIGPWYRTHGRRFLLDTVRWIRKPDTHGQWVRNKHGVRQWKAQVRHVFESYEIDSMTYIIDSQYEEMRKSMIEAKRRPRPTPLYGRRTPQWLKAASARAKARV